MREKFLQFFKRITKGDGSLRSVTDAPLTDAHILSPEELADFDRTLTEKSLPPLDKDAAGVVFEPQPQDRFSMYFVAGFLVFAFFMTLPNILAFGSALFTWRSLSFDMVFKAFILPVFSAVMLAGLVKAGFYRRLRVLVEPGQLRLRSCVFGRVDDRIIPFHRIADIRYERREVRRGWDGAALLLDSGETIPLLRLEHTGSISENTLENNNAGFLVRALSFASGVRVSGNITEDGLGAVAGGIEIDLRHPPPEEKPFEPLADALRRDLPPGNTVLTPASKQWRWMVWRFDYGRQKPLFAVRREHRRLLLSLAARRLFSACGAGRAGMPIGRGWRRCWRRGIGICPPCLRLRNCWRFPIVPSPACGLGSSLCSDRAG